MRHGESMWSQENRFTGWTDVGLTERGLAEARAAGQLLKREGYDFGVAFTSALRRAIKTLWMKYSDVVITGVTRLCHRVRRARAISKQ